MSNTTITTTDAGVTYKVTTNTSWTGTTYSVVITDPDGSVVYNGTIKPGMMGNGDVATTEGFSIDLASAFSGATYIVPAGLNGTINILASMPSGEAPTIYVGGTVTISTMVSMGGNLDIQVDGGTATLAQGEMGAFLSGTIVTLSNGGTFANGDSMLSMLSGITVDFGKGGGTFIVNSGGAFVDLSSTTIANYDPKYGVIEFAGTTSTVSTYVITGTGSQRTIVLYDASGNMIGRYTASLAPGVLLPVGTYNTASPENNPLSIGYDDGNTYVGLCFLEGMKISTPDGDRSVETIHAGDVVHVYAGGEMTARRVRWAGMAIAHVNKDKPEDMAGYPVHILKDAFEENIPSADLMVTPEHCLYFDGTFIPARMLVNGLSIYFDRTQADYKYYHIETEDHSVIKANNTLTESYLDTGNRHVFRQSGRLCAIGGGAKVWNQDSACALRVDREHVEPIYRHYEARAKRAGIADRRSASVRTSDPDIHLVDDHGRRIRKARGNGSLWVFMIPALTRAVRIVSRTMQPSRVMGSFVDDRRELGVLVGKATFFDSMSLHDVTIHLHNADLDGWNNLEPTACRWTAGNALLPLERDDPEGMGILSIDIVPASEYLIEEYASEVTALRA